MATVTDLDSWLSNNEPNDEEEKDQLIRSLNDISEEGSYRVTSRNGQYFVYGWSDDVLRLYNEEKRLKFIAMVEEVKVEDELEEGYRRNMENPNS